MAKDPAFLFYSSDFLTGTMFMSNEQVGIYIRLLCSQHQHGGIIEKIVFENLTAGHQIVKAKFIECEEGFYNERLAIEMEKRNSKSSNISKAVSEVWEKRRQSKANAIALENNAIPSKKDTFPMGIESENESENTTEKEMRKKESKTKEIEPLTCVHFSDPEFLKLWQTILQEPKWRKKSNNALRQAINKLEAQTLSVAKIMLQDAIVGGWQGLFPPRNISQLTNQPILTPKRNQTLSGK